MNQQEKISEAETKQDAEGRQLLEHLRASRDAQVLSGVKKGAGHGNLHNVLRTGK
jgi:hypothetical protein